MTNRQQKHRNRCVTQLFAVYRCYVGRIVGVSDGSVLHFFVQRFYLFSSRLMARSCTCILLIVATRCFVIFDSTKCDNYGCSLRGACYPESFHSVITAVARRVYSYTVGHNNNYTIIILYLTCNRSSTGITWQS
jgi:hypothetical protein